MLNFINNKRTADWYYTEIPLLNKLIAEDEQFGQTLGWEECVERADLMHSCWECKSFKSLHGDGVLADLTNLLQGI